MLGRLTPPMLSAGALAAGFRRLRLIHRPLSFRLLWNGDVWGAVGGVRKHWECLQDHLGCEEERLVSREEHLECPEEQLERQEEHLERQEEYLEGQEEHLECQVEHLERREAPFTRSFTYLHVFSCYFDVFGCIYVSQRAPRGAGAKNYYGGGNELFSGGQRIIKNRDEGRRIMRSSVLREISEGRRIIKEGAKKCTIFGPKRLNTRSRSTS